MKRHLQPQVRLPRQRPLVASLALALIAALAMDMKALAHDRSTAASTWPTAPAYLQQAQPAATTIKVLNCDDSGPGSLREAYAGAVDNLTIDMTDLKCSKITLTSGALTDPVNVGGHYGVIILGAGQIIDGGNRGRVLVERGAGLSLQNLTITSGKYTGNVGGGCIYSAGFVNLSSAVIVSSCQMSTLGNGSDARGGAIYAHDTASIRNGSSITASSAASVNGKAFGGAIWARNVEISFSTISGNNANGTQGSAGGGIFAYGYSDGSFATRVDRSTISNNRTGNYRSLGGGVYVTGAILVEDSTISGNQANYGGGIFVNSKASVFVNEFTQATISGNSAVNGGGMVLEYAAQLYNCTITNNRASADIGGLQLLGSAVKLNSTIIARNLSPVSPASADVAGDDSSLSGANNLIVASTLQTPVDTITQDPQLSPLQNNGGLTQTHALFSGSPAIDKGTNIRGDGNANDQRGAPFPRVVGRSADIGAFEYSPPEHIFADNFDLRPGDRLFLNGFE